MILMIQVGVLTIDLENRNSSYPTVFSRFLSRRSLIGKVAIVVAGITGLLSVVLIVLIIVVESNWNWLSRIDYGPSDLYFYIQSRMATLLVEVIQIWFLSVVALVADILLGRFLQSDNNSKET